MNSQAEARNADCLLPKRVGRCRASFRRYYYDSEEKKCKMFTYGGCRGNGNRFLTEENCRKECMQDN
ncbi:Kunitz/Bovine pancreatic trypsin inhibitor domain protein [Ancylostoma duodenale]|uniref:Kunitz/Bovine pancreatic trypsin inhibitor domain protein n=1 Tax=Ancylostoma duodenale TaxID=51022 RepID=A0A0C2CY52_9BILA|nr:Kunitz/Bovine pancreatic trypsin inhibitor domain protein [Ancylostoma duodenale]